MQCEQGTAIHRTVQGAAGKLLDLEPACFLLKPFMVMAESGQGRTWQRCHHPPVLSPSLGSAWEKRPGTGKEQVRDARFPLLHN